MTFVDKCAMLDVGLVVSADVHVDVDDAVWAFVELVKLHSEFVIMGVCVCLSSACVMFGLGLINICSGCVDCASVDVCVSLNSSCEDVSKSVDFCVPIHSGCVGSVGLVVSSAL